MDTISDLLTRIRNANMKAKDYVDIPASKMKQSVIKILKEEGFVKGSRFIEDNKQGVIRIYMKYGPGKERMIRKVTRISKPSRRMYVDTENIPKYKGGVGVVVLSTSKGIMTGKDAKKAGVGGELVCQIW